jgi:hypothetical protein
MFGTQRKLDEILLELKSQRNINATLERQIAYLRSQNKDLHNRIMSQNFVDYVQGSMSLAPEEPRAVKPEAPDEELAGTVVEE